MLLIHQMTVAMMFSSLLFQYNEIVLLIHQMTVAMNNIETVKEGVHAAMTSLRVQSIIKVKWLETRPDTRLPKSRAGGQGLYLGGSSKVKK